MIENKKITNYICISHYFRPETEETMTSLVKAVMGDDDFVITEEMIVHINAQKVITYIQG